MGILDGSLNPTRVRYPHVSLENGSDTSKRGIKWS